QKMNIFEKFAPFLQDYIYSHGWEELRDVQVRAAEVLFDGGSNLIIASPTASGKTEAAFFPVLSILSTEESDSVGALYIAPLKSLINDQFERLSEVLDLSGIPVYHWHGDVAASHKNKVLREPKGILQITPESLESMLMNRSNDIPRLFCGLRFIILDEIHTLTGSDRGNQILCQLNRISHLIGRDPIRIGLSATVGDIDAAANWLGAGSTRPTESINVPDARTKWRLGMEHFFIDNSGDNDSASDMPENEKYVPLDHGFEYIYDCSKDKKCLIFSNSREETEYLTATLRQIADRRNEEDVFQIHHGNLSASIREEAELKLKDEDIRTVTCATVTLELGIDIGRLQRIIQLESPHSVSSLLQRLGRSGRRGDPPEMMMVFREENHLPNTPLPQLMPWELIRAIAIVQLYLEERFIEPPSIRNLPFSLLFQQTISILASSGELTARALAEKVLSLPPFAHVSPEDYKTLLVSMLNNDYLEMTEEKGLIIGLKGERLISSFKFYAVFKDSEDFTVRCGSDEIGTITTPPPVGDRFALAGRVWEVEELDVQRKLIYCKQVKGKMEVSWPGDYGEIHTKILKRMKKVLEEDTVYPYLKENARKRLETAHHVAKNTGMLEKPIVHLGGYTWCLFPWLGTRSFRTLRKYIAHQGGRFGISNLEFEGCFYMTFRLENGDGESFMRYLKSKVLTEGIDKASLVSPNECPVFEKYDDRIPSELLRHAYVSDRLRTDEIVEIFKEM
ncbi:MAG: DEAD/DEAH box helicase, partial [Clostridia bacterium]|nr:DEAD/DEAH box helicase [Clostridia bacterium]